jgi:hypothetical protein
MKQKIILLFFTTLIVSCGSFNEGHAELHINKNISTGQELLDLQEALDKEIISEEEFEEQRTKILEANESYEIDIEEFENLDGDTSESVKIRVNINGDDIVSIDSEK